jgi:hypothetical protein
MDKMDRKSFVKVAGAGTVVAAAAGGVPLAAQLVRKDGDTLRFSAMGGLPQGKLPSYATHFVEGTVDLGTGLGTVTSRIVAGHPGEPSIIGLPGLSRVFRITSVDARGERYKLGGVVEDRSMLGRGESANVEIVVDRKKGIVEAPLAGRSVSLPIA